MKICVNCKHHHIHTTWDGVVLHTCKTLPIIDLITGVTTYRDCYDMRKAEGACGARGELFESKGFEKND